MKRHELHFIRSEIIGAKNDGNRPKTVQRKKGYYGRFFFARIVRSEIKHKCQICQKIEFAFTWSI